MYQFRAENSTGYKLSWDGGTNWDLYIADSSKYITKGDTLYRISSTNNAYGYWLSSPSAIGSSKYLTQGDNLYRINSQSNACAYWVSSPSANGATYVVLVSYNGIVGCTYSSTIGIGFRPVVCLKSGISLREVEFGKFYQI
ncbi:unknown [Clostridium sp. CAG:921]|nr:unknown [Clostridium sp. CAG:921]